MAEPLLEVNEVVKHFDSTQRRGLPVRAVDGVSLTVEKGSTLGLVGESGCGKSTLGRCIARLYDVSSGSIRVGGQEITKLSNRELQPLRRQVQMVFQDPFSSLNPRKRVRHILGDVMRVHKVHDAGKIRTEVEALLERVGLGSDFADRYARELSGGQRQRVGIARAIVLQPDLIVADEPVSALDVSIQAQILNLFADLQDEFGLTYVFISHDLGVVRQVSDVIGVMYLGKLMEIGPRDDIFEAPVHPYTEALLSAIPVPDPEASARERIVLRGDLPSASRPPPGCLFHTRCPRATEICKTTPPPLTSHRPGVKAACHHPLNV